MLQCLVAGGIAGTAVDTALFPLDTIKTRLQSQVGFRAAGGFSGVYSGLLSAVIGSAPSAAAFFVAYEYLKRSVGAGVSDSYAPLVHMISACVVRVPTEVIKQRMQTKQYSSTYRAIRSIASSDGILGFYRGYHSTVVREIPFTCIQFSLYEYLKKWYACHKGRPTQPWEAAVCGSITGGIAAAATTPLDVIKTRIMLSSRVGLSSGIISTFRKILHEEGWRALYSGIGPRVIWISLGGAVFLGMYEKAKKTLIDYRIAA
ncbi:mitochondrial carrier domain-containing protein [Dimargaris cristalligena]|uniref:Mitochondrial carrier domain-containing protein n=1 Tax=Dimargaris cristalligena TaxID=215637 RepID=A0A4P9ZNU7_9FUNG|nr:mitochondrial carrier domain-containing protein [Dimargaris cristalligena]|eukprot:RKP34865.1 mitochondrial carrier domain-containing protein [Dimargaris cristalligena]